MRKMCILYLCYYYYWTFKNSDNGRCITTIWDNELLPNQGKIKSNFSHKDFCIIHAASLSFSPSLPQSSRTELHISINFIWRLTWQRRHKCIIQSRMKWSWDSVTEWLWLWPKHASFLGLEFFLLKTIQKAISLSLFRYKAHRDWRG